MYMRMSRFCFMKTPHSTSDPGGCSATVDEITRSCAMNIG